MRLGPGKTYIVPSTWPSTVATVLQHRDPLRQLQKSPEMSTLKSSRKSYVLLVK